MLEIMSSISSSERNRINTSEDTQVRATRAMNPIAIAGIPEADSPPSVPTTFAKTGNEENSPETAWT